MPTLYRNQRLLCIRQASDTIEQGNRRAVIVETDDNYIDRLETEVRDGTLYINTAFGQSISNPTSLRYNVTVTELAALTIDGAGGTFITGFDAGELRITTDGAADAQISDLQADLLAVVMDGFGELEISGNTAVQQITLEGCRRLPGQPADRRGCTGCRQPEAAQPVMIRRTQSARLLKPQQARFACGSQEATIFFV